MPAWRRWTLSVLLIVLGYLMGRIVLLTAAALGDAPGGGNGLCLDARYTDDSAIIIES